jgi:hypothetical protein
VTDEERQEQKEFVFQRSNRTRGRNPRSSRVLTTDPDQTTVLDLAVRVRPNLSTLRRRQFHHQWMLCPDQVHLLVGPISTHILQSEIEIPQDLCHDDPHFHIRKANGFEGGQQNGQGILKVHESLRMRHPVSGNVQTGQQMTRTKGMRSA